MLYLLYILWILVDGLSTWNLSLLHMNVFFACFAVFPSLFSPRPLPSIFPFIPYQLRARTWGRAHLHAHACRSCLLTRQTIDKSYGCCFKAFCTPN